MSHYSDDPAMVRVDFWKESGKWYATEAVKWIGPYFGSKESSEKFKAPHGLIHDGFLASLRAHLKPTSPGNTRLRYSGMRATCLEPYHEHTHPISVIVPET